MKHLCFFAFLLIASVTVFSQNYGDKEYYLIDSLIIDSLSADDQKLIERCLADFHSAKHDTNRINSINEIVNESWDERVWPRYNQWIFDFTKQKIEQGQLKGEEERLMLGFYAGSLNNIGMYYSNKGKIKEALSNFQEALVILKKIREESVMAVCLNNIGILYNSQEDYETALKYFQESLEIREHLGGNQNTSAALNNIGYIYGKLENYDKAKAYHLRSLKEREKLGDKRGIAESLNNLGTVSRRKAEVLEKANGNKDSIQLKTDLALVYFKKSIQIQQEIKDVNGLSNTYNNIAHIYYDYNDLSQAEHYGEKALQYAQQNQHARNTKLSTELLARVYEEQSKGLLALAMYKLFISTRDSMQNIETQKTTIKQNLQYEFDKKEALAAVEHEKALAVAAAEKKKRTVVIWGASIVLVLIIAFALVINNRLKVSNAQKQVIQKKNAENELLLGEIHHRVKNNLQVISSLLSLQERNMDDGEAKAAILEGKERVRSMGLIHKLLYQNDNYSGVEMNDYVNKLIHGLMDSFGIDENQIDLELNFPKIKLDVDTAVPVGLIINELVINTFKYAYKNIDSPSLNVSLQTTDNQLILEVADNGGGKESELTNSNSFGMKLVRSLTRQLAGELVLNDDAGLKVQVNIKDYRLT